MEEDCRPRSPRPTAVFIEWNRGAGPASETGGRENATFLNGISAAPAPARWTARREGPTIGAIRGTADALCRNPDRPRTDPAQRLFRDVRAGRRVRPQIAPQGDGPRWRAWRPLRAGARRGTRHVPPHGADRHHPDRHPG